jgi:hypothetical protein
MATLQTIGYIIEAITILAGVISIYYVLRRNRKYLGNVMMASSIGCVTLYIFSITVYDIFLPITENEIWVDIFLPIAMFAIVSAGMFMFFTMMTMTKGAWWVKNLKKSGIYIAVVAAWGIFILSQGWKYIWVDDYEIVDTGQNLFLKIILGVVLLFFIVGSIILTYKSGIKKTDGITKKKLIRFEIGLCIMLFALIFNIVKGFVGGGPNVGGILDMIYFGILAGGTVVFAISILTKEKHHENEEQKQDTQGDQEKKEENKSSQKK